MSNLDLEFGDLLLSVMDESKCTNESSQRDFNGGLSFEELINSVVSKLQNRANVEGYFKLIEMRVKRKNDSAAEDKRKDGNDYFKKSDLKMALRNYNESIKLSPHPSMEDVPDEKQSISYQNLSFSYGNRAAVLFEMGLYDETCTDIRRAVNLGYSRPKQKLSVRYCNSMIYLHLKKNHTSQITSSVFDTVFEKTETNLDFVLDDEHRKQIMEHKFDVKIAAIKKSKISKYIEAPKPVLEGEHPHIPGLSNKVEFAANVKKGRYLIAAEDIYPGTLLAVDPGFVAAALVPKHVGENCSACSKPCELIFLPCHQCTSAVFCNEKCRDEAFKSYHHYECSVLPILYTQRVETISCLTLRIITSLGYSKLYDYIKEEEKREEEEAKEPSMAKRGLSSEGIYDSKSYRTVYYLTDHKEKRDSIDLFYRSGKAVVMTLILKMYSTFFGQENYSSEHIVSKVHFNECEMLIAKLILRHLMSMEVNSTSNYSCTESQELLNMKTIGTNVQCLFSLIGHSCNPNAICADPHTLRSMAIIPKGTEICICYTKPFIGMSKQKRQDILRRFYFTCECIACVEDWPTFDWNIMDTIFNIRVKCMFGCKNGTLNKLAPRCTKCSKGLKKKKPLYSETYLKHIKKIIYGSSSENSKSIQRDMALTTLSFFDELETQIKSFTLFPQSEGNSIKMITKEIAYVIFKGIYLFDKYSDCPNHHILCPMRHSLQIFHAFSSIYGTVQ